MSVAAMVDFKRLISEKVAMREAYRDAKPYEHLCIDDFLTLEGLARLRSDNPATEPSTDEKSSDYMFAKNKRENNCLEEISPSFSQLRNELISKEFGEFLEFLTGLPMFIDPDFTGGGLHQGGKGSYLEMHADFSRHPVRHDWVRELNVLLYLNKDYHVDWGGALDLEHLHNGQKVSIAPVENRMIIMLSKSHTLHGYKRINFPKGIYRASVAAYGYIEDDGSSQAGYTSTVWAPKSGLKRAMAVVLNKLVPVKQAIFGSRTAARNARSKD